ncbi:peptidylprolyl isomerase [Roseococcus microcysteis]|uniref:peptidylprolyl isomerase n=1 Tax=Roseococcus microcysteis TaxID=2771361 RepID=UPI00168B2CEA|nr:peptidylprolyl isomerase [Roseococcus microcysteis]
MARFPLAALLLAGTFLAPGVHAQAPARPPAAPPTAATPAPAADPNPVLARVDGQEIRLEEVIAAAAEAMPAELRNVPPQVLRTMLPPEVFNQLLDRAISDRAMVIAARRANVQDDPEFRARMRAFEENALRDTLLRREVLPRLTDEALRARHARDQAAAPEQEEVRARHILVANEADARAIITQIQGGANFEEVARSRSTDPAGRNGGDLGFFARGDMVPEFANAAFALQPGQLSPNPVRTQFGWHVIRVEERRTTRGPAFEEARDTLRQRMIEEEVNAVIERVRAATTIERVEAPAAPATPPGPIQAVPPPPPARR